MDDAHTIRARLRVDGKVQGVFFRASTVEQAVKLGLTGWVRNCPDGSVEVLAEGRKEKIDALANWCRQGPPGARVRGITIDWEHYRDEFEDFRVRR
jgi:acylphosphatase